MQELLWNITKFNHIFSYPSDAGDGAESYAQDMVNLRVDRWGHLRLRPAIRALQMHEAGDIAPEGLAITGVAASANALYWLRSDGKLFCVGDIPADPFEIRNVDNLSGRLSIVSRIGDDNLTILTSSGSDQGYIIYNNIAEPLGIIPPKESDFIIELGSGSVALDDEYTFYRLTFSGEGATGELESGSFRYAVRLRQTLGVGNQQDLLDAGSYYISFELQEKPVDLRITHLNIYRSAERYADENALDSQIQYHRVARLNISQNAGNYPQDFFDKKLKTDVDVSNPLVDNSNLPTSVSQITLFNDRLFGATGDELRFSEVRNGVPFWHTWPVINSIRTGSRIDFCAAYRGMLLFGGADGLYRLSGTSPANFRYDQISARGPVSPHAWGVLDNAFGFVGADGLYLTDGTAAPEIAPQLKGYFNRYEVEGGLVGMFPNKASFWAVWRRNKATDAVDAVYFVNDGGDWVRVVKGSDATAIRQYASVKFDGLPITGVIADQQRAPRLIDWVVDDASVDGITHYTGGTPVEEDIAWSWESQELDWNAQGLGEQMKVFTELDISGTAENDVIVTFYVDDRAPVTKTVRLDRAAHDRFHPVRVRIDRRGFGCRFKLEGTGAVTLRGLQMKGWV